jgi:hypothetical protein
MKSLEKRKQEQYSKSVRDASLKKNENVGLSLKSRCRET